MKKAFVICLLTFCLLAGFAIEKTAYAPPAAVPEQAASVLPHSAPQAEAVAADFEVPAPNTAMVPLPASDALAVAQATDEPETQEVELSERLDRIFTGLPDFRGSVLIEKTGRVILCKSYGMADVEKGIGNTPDTKFLIGSVTKQFTAMAVMQLYEKGLLDLNDKLSVYMPEFSRGDEITLENLLTQTSGIIDYMNAEPPLLSQIPYEALSAQHIIDLAAEKPLRFDPGTKYAYSNTNYLILGHIVEEVSGLRYSDYLARYIFEPLGMENTGVFDIGKPPENMAAGHMRPDAPVRYYTAGGEVIPDSASFIMGSYGAGCLYSTVGDLYLWDQALSTEKLISRRYLNIMFNPSVPVPGAIIECAYGYGWVIDNDPVVGTILRHTGVLSGFRAYNGLFADSGEIVIILYNIKEFDGRETMLPSLKQALKDA